MENSDIRNSDNFFRYSHFLISIKKTWEKHVIDIISKTLVTMFTNAVCYKLGKIQFNVKKSTKSIPNDMECK